MPDQPEYSSVIGSERPPLEGARPAGRLAGAELVEVTVYLRPRAGAPEPPAGTVPLSRAQLAEARGADPADLAALEAYAASHGLTVLERDQAGRRLRLRGPATAMEEAFGVQLERFEHPGGEFRSHRGAVHLPTALAGSVVAVLGLDDRPQARAHFRPAAAAATSYTPLQVAAAYGAPAGLSGKGVCVALVELGGGYATADLQAYFAQLGLAVPTVEAVPVDGGANAPSGDASGPDGEVMLDIEVVGAVANGATIAVYFAPNTDQGFADAISAAVHDATTRSPAVVSISWGGPENSYTAQAVKVFEQAFADAALAGVSVLVAAGDSGSSDGVGDGLAHVDYPASSPQVLGCGGTRLELQAGTIASEVVWNDGAAGGATGGGVSATFPLPAWQASAGVPASANPGGAKGRGVPDVAGDADPDSGYVVRVDGVDTVIGGTSAVAPLYAGILALAVERAGRPVGFVNPACYAARAAAFRDITSGNNGAYTAGQGWDACTGLGAPVVPALLEAVTASAATAPAAGTSPTPG